MWHQWFKLNYMKLREYFLCAKKTKIMTSFINLFFSVSVFAVRSREYHNASVYCWPRGGRSFSVTLIYAKMIYYKFFQSLIFVCLIMNIHCFYSRLCSIPSSCRLPVPCCPWTMRSLCVAAIWECFHPTMNHGATLQVTHRTQTHTLSLPFY